MCALWGGIFDPPPIQKLRHKNSRLAARSRPKQEKDSTPPHEKMPKMPKMIKKPKKQKKSIIILKTLALTGRLATKATIRCRSLAAVALVTKRLPVALIPHELIVAAMGLNVIDISSCDKQAAFSALAAEGVPPQISGPGFLPPVAVATGGGRAAPVISGFASLCEMSRAKAAIIVHQCAAARCAAGSRGGLWHLR